MHDSKMHDIPQATPPLTHTTTILDINCFTTSVNDSFDILS